MSQTKRCIKPGEFDDTGSQHAQPGAKAPLAPATSMAVDGEEGGPREGVRALKRATALLARHWLALANVAWGLVFGLPWLAPVLMKVGARGPAEALYFVYSFLCHQLADRSFFLFGEKASYAAAELLPLAGAGDPRLALRAFRGTPDLGYKVAWSDRMVALYGGIFLGRLIFALLRHRLRTPNLVWPALLLVPMALDGSTHVLSDFAGFNVGFRYSNTWLAFLTGHRLSSSFYVGNGLGSFNSWARLISGTLAGLALAWPAYPEFETYFSDVRSALQRQLAAPPQGRVSEAGAARLQHTQHTLCAQRTRKLGSEETP